jgi:acyl-CoA thioester hydrolase
MALDVDRPTDPAAVHALRLRVAKADTEIASGIHVHYSIYPQYMDRAVSDQLAKLGFERVDSYKTLHGFEGIHAMEIEYLAPAMAGDELLVETWVESARGIRLTRAFEIRKEPRGELLVRARTHVVWVTDAHRPGRWPPELLAALGVDPSGSDPATD